MKTIRTIGLLTITLLLCSFITTSDRLELNQDTEYLTVVDEMPSPVGGLGEIYKQITEYPKIAKATNIQGKVYILAFVNEKGGVDEAKVVKGIGGGCDEAAIEAVKKTKFTPGKVKGQPVKAKFSVAVTFKIDK